MLVQILADFQQDFVGYDRHHIHPQLYKHDIDKVERQRKKAQPDQPVKIPHCYIMVKRFFDNQRVDKRNADRPCHKYHYTKDCPFIRAKIPQQAPQDLFSARIVHLLIIPI